MKIINHLRALLAATLVSIVGLNPATAQDSPAKTTPAQTVKVGCLLPLTGPGGRYGHDSIAAIQMAKEDLAASSETTYPILDVKVRDTRSKSLRSVQIARSFIEKDSVDFLCGVVSSNVAMAVTQVAKSKKVFFIGTDHASPRLTAEALHPYYFRVSNGTRQSMLAGAQYIRQYYATKKKLKIAFIGPDYDYGYQAWKDLRSFLHKENVLVDVVSEVWPKPFETDYSIHIHALIDAKPDIVVNGHWGQDLVTFVKQAKGLGLFEKTTFMNFDAGGNFEILAELGDEMPLGLILSARHHINWPDTASNRSFVQRFKTKQGRYPSYAAEGAYAGILAIAKAVRQANGVSNKDEIRKALEHLRLKLPEDPKGFTSYMDPASHQIMQVQAIGKTLIDNHYSPAKVMLGNWKAYYPPKSWPTEPHNETPASQ